VETGLRQIIFIIWDK